MSITRATGFLATLSLMLSFQATSAGEAFFSEDGASVFLAPCGTASGLIQIDVASGEVTHAPLPKELQEECIESIARGSDGEVLFLAKDAVWVWTPDAAKGKQVKRVCPTAPVVNATNLFVDTTADSPLQDCLFVSGTDAENPEGDPRFFGRRPAAKATFEPIFCRSVNDAVSGLFAEDGRLYFTCNRDIWEGGIQMEEDTTMGRLGVLVAARTAPLAVLTTDEGGGGMGVVNVAVAGKWIYAHLQGRHMSAIVRTPKPAKAIYAPGLDAEGGPSIKQQHTAMAKALTQTQIITEDAENPIGLCAIEVDGAPLVFYYDPALTDKGSSLMLWEGEGKPRAIGYLPEQ